MKQSRMKRLNQHTIRTTTIIVVLSCSLFGCATTHQKAPIEDRKQQKSTNPVQATTPTTSGGVKEGDTQSYYVVKKGDTLHRIALDKGQNYNDLILWNNLKNPNDIKVGQTLRVNSPDTPTSGVITTGGVEVRPLGASPSSPGSARNKNGPRADKRPYSDEALAELQKSEASVVASTQLSEKPTEIKPESAVIEEIDWVWPVDGKVTANFDVIKNKGIDISGKLGQDVYAAAAGTVLYARSELPGYGSLVIIKHSANFLSAYAHNQKIVVKEKQTIIKGQKIAEMGISDTNAVKLHFEIRQQGKPVDPIKFLPGR